MRGRSYGYPRLRGPLLFEVSVLVTHSAEAALTGTGTETISGIQTASGAAALTGVGTQTVVGTDVGAITLTGVGSLSASGTHTALATAALTGAGVLTVSGSATALMGGVIEVWVRQQGEVLVSVLAQGDIHARVGGKGNV